jgi:hypothetical protein
VNTTLVKEIEVKNGPSESNDVMLPYSEDRVSDILRSESIDSATDCFDQELAKHMNILVTPNQIFERVTKLLSFF